MIEFPKTPDAIAKAMTGHFDGRSAVLPSPAIQNHAGFLTQDRDGHLECVWFGGSLEGKADICVYKSRFANGAWSEALQLTDDPNRSEQNPILFYAPDGSDTLLHTAQPGGNQDECIVQMREPGHKPSALPFPKGTFIRAMPHVLEDGTWLLPLFHCVPKNGARWTGRHDTASVAITNDKGKTWRIVDVPHSVGCVHMTIVPAKDRLLAFYRRRQADFVYRSESLDNGASWSVPSATPLPNNNSSIAALRLQDGRLAICCNPINKDMSDDRRASLYDELGDDSRPEADGGCDAVWGIPRAPLIVALSDDDGVSFSHHITVADSSGKCLSNDSLDGKNQELSYPGLAEAPEGGLDVVFTLHRRAIAHVRLTAAEIGASK